MSFFRALTPPRHTDCSTGARLIGTRSAGRASFTAAPGHPLLPWLLAYSCRAKCPDHNSPGSSSV